MATTIPQRIEPKTFFANERTFLSWLHMAVTIGSIGAALLGFSGSAPRDPHASPAVRPQFYNTTPHGPYASVVARLSFCVCVPSGMFLAY